MSPQEVYTALSAEFTADELEYRALRVGKRDDGSAWALPAIVARMS